MPRSACYHTTARAVGTVGEVAAKAHAPVLGREYLARENGGLHLGDSGAALVDPLPRVRVQPDNDGAAHDGRPRISLRSSRGRPRPLHPRRPRAWWKTRLAA